MRIFSKSPCKIAYKSFLLGTLLVTCALISVATLTHEVFRNLKRIEEDFANLKQQQTANEDRSIQKHVIEKRSAPGNNNVDIGDRPHFGSTYVRWGRRDCPIRDGTQLVYEGFAGGSYYTHVGGGSDFICLHSDPTYTPGRYSAGYNAAADVYGVEYRDSSAAYHLFDLSQIEGGALLYQGVPCAVCLINSFSHLMIPSRETCPGGWTIEYTGYIMTGGNTDTKHSSTYICVDDTPQAISGTNGNQQGAYLYLTEISCGNNVPCEPYVGGREIRCVVCSFL